MSPAACLLPTWRDAVKAVTVAARGAQVLHPCPPPREAWGYVAAVLLSPDLAPCVDGSTAGAAAQVSRSMTVWVGGGGLVAAIGPAPRPGRMNSPTKANVNLIRSRMTPSCRVDFHVLSSGAACRRRADQWAGRDRTRVCSSGSTRSAGSCASRRPAVLQTQVCRSQEEWVRTFEQWRPWPTRRRYDRLVAVQSSRCGTSIGRLDGGGRRTQPSNNWNECEPVRAPSAVIVNAVPRWCPRWSLRRTCRRCLDKAGVGVGAVEVARQRD